MTTPTSQTEIRIAMKADLARADLTLGLVWFVNYAALDPSCVTADQLDLHGAAMMPEDVQKFAHRWLAHSRSIDINHDGIGRPIHVVESFFNSEDVASPAWPVNSHAVRFDLSQCQEAMDGMRSGALNSVSLDAFTFNKVVRLPASQVRASTKSGPAYAPPDPSDLAGWAAELAEEGFSGIRSVHLAAPGLFVADRGAMPPIAIEIDSEGIVEAASAGGVWARIAARVSGAPSLVGSPEPTSRSYTVPTGPVLVGSLGGAR